MIFCGAFASWTVTNRAKEFYILLLVLVSGVFGVFVAQDLFFFFLFYEIAVLPMYLLIGIWGTGPKEYSAMKLTLYLLVGSAFMLVGILGMYFSARTPGGMPLHTFDLVTLSSASYAATFQRVAFFLLYIGFGILAGIWPLHTWSPDGHASAPTAVSMLHAGVLMKLGAYGLLRVGYGALPLGAHYWAWLVGGIAVINIAYGAYVAMGQKDLKYVIAYSSVSHMGVVMLGLAAYNEIAITGSVMQMVSHGIMTGLFFALVGLVYEKAHTRDITAMGGFATRMPGIAIAFTIGGLASFGLPGTSGFRGGIAGLFGRLPGATDGTPVALPDLRADRRDGDRHHRDLRAAAVPAHLPRAVQREAVSRPRHRAHHGMGRAVGAGRPAVGIGLYPTWLADLIRGSLGPLLR